MILFIHIHSHAKNKSILAASTIIPAALASSMANCSEPSLMMVTANCILSCDQLVIDMYTLYYFLLYTYSTTRND